MANMDAALVSWREQSSSAAEEWLSDNNNRINLFQISGIRDAKWDDEPMDSERAAQLLAIKRLILSIKVMAEADDAEVAARKLDQILNECADTRFINDTAIDTLARMGKIGGDRLMRIMRTPEMPDIVRARVALSMLRYGQQMKNADKLATEVLERIVASESMLVLNSAIELAGLIGADVGRSALDIISKNIKNWPAEKRIWLERDLISTRLTIDPSYQDSVAIDLRGRAWVSKSGIVFGALIPRGDFEKFVASHGDRLEKMAETLTKINAAFGKEPVMYVDLIMEGKKGDGWTQNSVYASAEIIGHSRVTEAVNAQGIGHEACERWENKGFVDAGMEREYLQMMGDVYSDSVLDKFRLSHRMDIPTHAGHPWDGSREYIAELGSTLLVDPEAVKRLFDPNKDKVAFDALESLEKRLQQFRAGK